MADQVPEGAEDLDAVAGNAGNTLVELLVQSISEEDDGTNTVADVGRQLLKGAGGECSSLTIEWVRIASQGGQADGMYLYPPATIFALGQLLATSVIRRFIVSMEFCPVPRGRKLDARSAG